MSRNIAPPRENWLFDGALVLAPYPPYPPWPSIILEDPVTEKWYRYRDKNQLEIYILFLEWWDHNRVTFDWVKASSLEQYLGGPKLGKKALKRDLDDLHKAVEFANELMPLNSHDRKECVNNKYEKPPDSEMFFNGALVLATVPTYPAWPSIICEDPESGKWWNYIDEDKVKYEVYVIFFNWFHKGKITYQWIKPTSLQQYDGKETKDLKNTHKKFEDDLRIAFSFSKTLHRLPLKNRLKKANEQTECRITYSKQEQNPDKELEQKSSRLGVKRKFTGTPTRGPPSKRVKTDSVYLKTPNTESKFVSDENKKTEEKELTKTSARKSKEKAKSQQINKNINERKETDNNPFPESKITYLTTQESLTKKEKEQEPIAEPKKDTAKTKRIRVKKNVPRKSIQLPHDSNYTETPHKESNLERVEEKKLPETNTAGRKEKLNSHQIIKNIKRQNKIENAPSSGEDKQGGEDDKKTEEKKIEETTTRKFKGKAKPNTINKTENNPVEEEKSGEEKDKKSENKKLAEKTARKCKAKSKPHPIIKNIKVQDETENIPSSEEDRREGEEEKNLPETTARICKEKSESHPVNEKVTSQKETENTPSSDENKREGEEDKRTEEKKLPQTSGRKCKIKGKSHPINKKIKVPKKTKNIPSSQAKITYLTTRESTTKKEQEPTEEPKEDTTKTKRIGVKRKFSRKSIQVPPSKRAKFIADLFKKPATFLKGLKLDLACHKTRFQTNTDTHGDKYKKVEDLECQEQQEQQVQQEVNQPLEQEEKTEGEYQDLEQQIQLEQFNPSSRKNGGKHENLEEQDQQEINPSSEDKNKDKQGQQEPHVLQELNEPFHKAWGKGERVEQQEQQELNQEQNQSFLKTDKNWAMGVSVEEDEDQEHSSSDSSYDSLDVVGNIEEDGEKSEEDQDLHCKSLCYTNKIKDIDYNIEKEDETEKDVDKSMDDKLKEQELSPLCENSYNTCNIPYLEEEVKGAKSKDEEQELDASSGNPCNNYYIESSIKENGEKGDDKCNQYCKSIYNIEKEDNIPEEVEDNDENNWSPLNSTDEDLEVTFREERNADIRTEEKQEHHLVSLNNYGKTLNFEDSTEDEEEDQEKCHPSSANGYNTANMESNIETDGVKGKEKHEQHLTPMKHTSKYGAEKEEEEEVTHKFGDEDRQCYTFLDSPDKSLDKCEEEMEDKIEEEEYKADREQELDNIDSSDDIEAQSAGQEEDKIEETDDISKQKLRHHYTSLNITDNTLTVGDNTQEEEEPTQEMENREPHSPCETYYNTQDMKDRIGEDGENSEEEQEKYSEMEGDEIIEEDGNKSFDNGGINEEEVQYYKNKNNEEQQENCVSFDNTHHNIVVEENIEEEDKIEESGHKGDSLNNTDNTSNIQHYNHEEGESKVDDDGDRTEDESWDNADKILDDAKMLLSEYKEKLENKNKRLLCGDIYIDHYKNSNPKNDQLVNCDSSSSSYSEGYNISEESQREIETEKNVFSSSKSKIEMVKDIGVAKKIDKDNKVANYISESDSCDANYSENGDESTHLNLYIDDHSEDTHNKILGVKTKVSPISPTKVRNIEKRMLKAKILKEKYLTLKTSNKKGDKEKAATLEKLDLDEYTILSLEIETIRESNRKRNDIVQIGCTAMKNATKKRQSTFFEAIQPPKIKDYMEMKMNGDLLKCLNIKQTDKNEFEYRKHLETVQDENDGIKCTTEEDALRSFSQFLLTFKNPILICLEDKKITTFKEKLRKFKIYTNVKGFCTWKSFSEGVNSFNTKLATSTEFEEFIDQAGMKIPENPNALDVSTMLRGAVKFVKKTSQIQDLNKVMSRISIPFDSMFTERQHPNIKDNLGTPLEFLEISKNWEQPAQIEVESMEQSDSSDTEYETQSKTSYQNSSHSPSSQVKYFDSTSSQHHHLNGHLKAERSNEMQLVSPLSNNRLKMDLDFTLSSPSPTTSPLQIPLQSTLNLQSTVNTSFLYSSDNTPEGLHYFVKGEERLKINNLCKTIPRMNKEYFVSFEFNAMTVKKGFFNLVHFITEGKTNYMAATILGVFIDTYRLLVIHNPRNYNHIGDVVLPKKWIRVEISQKYENNECKFSVVVDGHELYQKIITNPKDFNSVEIYAGNPRHNALDGSIRNFFLNNQDQSHLKVFAVKSTVKSDVDEPMPKTEPKIEDTEMSEISTSSLNGNINPLYNRKGLASNSDINAFISDMANRINLPQPVTDRVNKLFKAVYDGEKLKERSNEVIAAACMIIACRQHGVPRTMKEIAGVSSASIKKIGKCFKIITQAYNISVPITTEDFISRYCNALMITRNIENVAVHVAKRWIDLDLKPRRSLVSVAAAAICMALQGSDDKRTMADIADITCVSEVNMRQCYKGMTSVASLLFPPNTLPKKWRAI